MHRFLLRTQKSKPLERWLRGQVKIGRQTTSFSTQHYVTPSEVQEHDAIVIGGGVAGASALYHLSKLGARNPLLLEQNEVTSGTTWHSAGLLWRLRPHDFEVALMAYTQLLASSILEEETGLSPGWRNNGGLFLASTPQRLDEYRRMAHLSSYFGIPSEILTPQQAKERFPILDFSQQVGVMYSPFDGTIEPSGLVSAFIAAAKKRGAKVREKTAVKGLILEPSTMGRKRIKGVITESGEIRAKRVLNCGGVWANHIAGFAGVSLPLEGLQHAYVVSDRIEGAENLPNVRDHDGSVYVKSQGSGSLALGGYEPLPIRLPWYPADPPDTFAFGLFDLDWDHFERHFSIHRRLIPKLEECGIRSTVCGPESFTPDHRALLGELAEVEGFYVSAGYNSAGIMQAGLGEQVARQMLDLPLTNCVHPFDVNRFDPRLTKNREWVMDRAVEAYALNYNVAWPHDQHLAGRGTLWTPFRKQIESDGDLNQRVVWGDVLGRERPEWYRQNSSAVAGLGTQAHNEAIAEDYVLREYSKNEIDGGLVALACRQRAALFDQSALGKIRVTGPESVLLEAFEMMCASHVAKRERGASVYTVLCDQHGRVQSELTIHKNREDPNEIYVVTNSSSRFHDLHVLRSRLGEWSALSVEDLTDQKTALALMGPNAMSLLAKLLESGTPEEDLSFKHFPYGTNQRITLKSDRGNKIECRALRISYVGESGLELHFDNEFAEELWQTIVKEGRNFGLNLAGARALESLALEAGNRHFNVDLRQAVDSPHESSLGFLCKLKDDDPDFIGKSSILDMKKSGGPTRKLFTFASEEKMKDPNQKGSSGRTRILVGDLIYRDETAVGYVSRASFGWGVDKVVATGFIQVKANESVSGLQKSQFRIVTPFASVPVSLHARPVYDPSRKKLKGE
eukprot:TRINITY_DN5346_c0_g1_i1.p1 TRINITY_DN5346_c0_g1~~TRINITY_DN5346_c0_g1_i1.p1  ORF type:complete len:920 (-),score=183.92 TRINITY_DN5346_c0_g1_i1:22-2745(-)